MDLRVERGTAQPRHSPRLHLWVVCRTGHQPDLSARLVKRRLRDPFRRADIWRVGRRADRCRQRECPPRSWKSARTADGDRRVAKPNRPTRRRQRWARLRGTPATLCWQGRRQFRQGWRSTDRTAALRGIRQRLNRNEVRAELVAGLTFPREGVWLRGFEQRVYTAQVRSSNP